MTQFQLLRNAAEKNKGRWKHYYGEKFQYSRDYYRSWISKCIFVPASVVINAIKDEMELSCIVENEDE